MHLVTFLLLPLFLGNSYITDLKLIPKNDRLEDGWDIEALNTAKDADYLSEVEKEIILEINMVRSNPSRYAEVYLIPKRSYFDGKRLSIPGRITIMTSEGMKALDECIRDLKKAHPVPILYPAKGMCMAARDLARDQEKNGGFGHTGHDGSNPSQRIGRYGQWQTTIGENVDYGSAEARDILFSLLVDDGVSSRGHRKNLLNAAYNVIGIAVAGHPEYQHLCVMDFAGGFD